MFNESSTFIYLENGEKFGMHRDETEYDSHRLLAGSIMGQ